MVHDGSAPLLVYGTVLPWLSDIRRTPLTGFAAFEAALLQQQADWHTLQATYSDCMFCVAGDFNQDLLESGHDCGSSDGCSTLRSAVAAARLVRVSAGVHDLGAKLWLGSALIDHIFVSNAAAYEARSVLSWLGRHELGRNLTDHFGVAVTLSRA